MAWAQYTYSCCWVPQTATAFSDHGQTDLVEQKAVFVKEQQPPVLHGTCLARDGCHVKLLQGLLDAGPRLVEVQSRSSYLGNWQDLDGL